MNNANIHIENIEELCDKLRDYTVNSKVEYWIDGEECYIDITQENSVTGNSTNWSFCIDFGTNKVYELEPYGNDLDSFSSDNEIYDIIKRCLRGDTSTPNKDHAARKGIRVGALPRINQSRRPIKSGKFQVGYFDEGEEWLKTVVADNKDEAIKMVKDEFPTCEIKDCVELSDNGLEMYEFEAVPQETGKSLDLTTDRFEPKADWGNWGEFTDNSRELETKLYKVLEEKGLYPEDIIAKEKDGVTKVYIDIGGDWKHEHGYLNYVMTEELGYMEIDRKELYDDFFTEDNGGDSYKARHVYIMFPDLKEFNKMRGINNSRKSIKSASGKGINVFGILATIKKQLEDLCINEELDSKLEDYVKKAISAVRAAREQAYGFNGYFEGLSQSRKPVKSSNRADLIKQLEDNPNKDNLPPAMFYSYLSKYAKERGYSFEDTKDWTVKEWLMFLNSYEGKKKIKSGYYNDYENHPDGGGTCDYCGTEIAPGDGYESDFQSSQDTAAYYLYIALGGDENYAYQVTENWYDFVRWLRCADEDIDEDWLQDAVNDICEIAFGDDDGYMCSQCLDKRIKEAAQKWVDENW